MSLNNPSAGLNFAAEFQSSGYPWCSSSIAPTSGYIKHEFSYVSKFVTLVNLESTAGRNLRVAFTSNGLSLANYFLVPPATSITLDVKVKELYVKADAATAISCSVIAGLTLVNATQMPLLTGSTDSGLLWSGVG